MRVPVIFDYFRGTREPGLDDPQSQLRRCLLDPGLLRQGGELAVMNGN